MSPTTIFFWLVLGATALFFMFTAAQLLGFVFRVLDLAVTGLFNLMAWILRGGNAILKSVFVLAAVFFFGLFKIAGIALLLLLVVMAVGLLRLVHGPDRRAFERPEEAALRHLRRTLDKMKRRMETLETVMGERRY